MDVPATVAVKGCIAEVETDELFGVILSETLSAAPTVMLAVADFVRSATLVAVTVTIAGEGRLGGGTYNPFVEIAPQDAPLQPVPLIAQVTAVFGVPTTFPVNSWVVPTITVAWLGFTVIETWGALTVSIDALLVMLPVELLTATVNWLPLSAAVVTGVM